MHQVCATNLDLALALASSVADTKLFEKYDDHNHKMLHQVCGTSLALSWIFASVAHKSLPEIPEHLGEADFNAHQVKTYYQR